MKGNKFSLAHIFIVFIITAANAFSFPLVVSLVVDVVAALFLGGSLRTNRGGGKIRSIYLLLIFLCIYTFLVCIANFSFSSYTLGKPIRLIVFYTLFIFISGRLAQYSNKEIAFGLMLALLLHLASVYAQFFIPTLKTIFTSFLRFDDKVDLIIEDPLRAFGLDSSFDGAGLDICILLVLLWLLFKRSRDIKFFLLGCISLLGCFMVGRTAMLVGTIVFVLMLMSLIKKNKIYFFIATAIVAIGVFYVWEIVQFYMNNNDVTQSYRPETVTWLTSDRMLFLPESFLGTVFGTGESPSNSDIGYIKIIHMIGFVGLSLVLYLYYSTIKAIKPYKRIDKDIYMFMLIFLILLLAYNYKLLLLYSRGINDVYFLLIFIILRKQSIAYANNKISCVQ